MVYNLYFFFFRKTKSEKAIPFRHLIATSLSSSSLDHILAPLPHTLLHPSTQRTWIKKEVGRSPTASQSVKGSKQTDTRYLKDLLHRGYTTVSGSYGLSMSACQREGGNRHTVGASYPALGYLDCPDVSDPGASIHVRITELFQSW